jgi:hypothetical protein
LPCTAAASAGLEGKLPKLGAAVTYSVVITNGARAVPVTNNFVFTTTPAYDAGSLECTMPNSVAVTADAALPAELVAGATLNCSFTVSVTAAHEAADKIPAVVVQPGFVDTPMDYSLAVAPSTSAEVAVYTGSVVQAAGVTLAAGETKYLSGETTPQQSSKHCA